jgi:hypothetical protein
MLIRDPVLQELNRQTVTKRGVATAPVVEHFDVVKEALSSLRKIQKILFNENR